jgi:hypothetical protein
VAIPCEFNNLGLIPNRTYAGAAFASIEQIQGLARTLNLRVRSDESAWPYFSQQSLHGLNFGPHQAYFWTVATIRLAARTHRQKHKV